MPNSGTTNALVTMTYPANELAESRQGQLQLFKGAELIKTITVTQSGKPNTNYVQVQYLEATANNKNNNTLTTQQFINTGIIANESTIATIECAIDPSYASDATGQFIFGARTNTSEGKFVLRTGQVDLGNINNTTHQTAIQATIDGKKHKFTVKGIGSVSIDDGTALLIDTGVTSFNTTYPIYIFGGNCNNNGAPMNQFPMKLYSFTIENNGIKQFEGIPVLDPDNKPALFDLVSESYFYNQGIADDFNVGPAITTITATSFTVDCEDTITSVEGGVAVPIIATYEPVLANSGLSLTAELSNSTLGVVSVNTNTITYTPAASTAENITGTLTITLENGFNKVINIQLNKRPAINATSFTVNPTSITSYVNASKTISVAYEPTNATDNLNILVSVEPETLGTATFADGVITFNGLITGSGAINATLADGTSPIVIPVTVNEMTTEYLAYYDFANQTDPATTTIIDQTGNTTARLTNFRNDGTYGLDWEATGLKNTGKDGSVSGGVDISVPATLNSTDCPNGVKIVVEYENVRISKIPSSPDTNYRGRILKLPTSTAYATDTYIYDMYTMKNTTLGIVSIIQFERKSGDVGGLIASATSGITETLDNYKVRFEFTVPNIDAVDYSATYCINDGDPKDFYENSVTTDIKNNSALTIGGKYPSQFADAFNKVTRFELLNRTTNDNRGLNGILSKFYIEKL